MVDWLPSQFPRLQGTDYRITSAATESYNCTAWAAGVTNVWWWPLPNAIGFYWPPNVARAETVEAIVAAFATLGYGKASNADLELEFEKVALFANLYGVPTHAARQTSSNRWTSKIGYGEDIEHDLHTLEGDLYGAVVLILKRARTNL
ncbi:MAG: hypothetical protein EXS16_04175 [Gemmataceae bacterium]|nr:hypothetical protein [Gemmataceae bacterium]